MGTPSAAPPPVRHEPGRAALCERLLRVRSLSLALTEPLTAEDMMVQAMDDASPTKWHLAHTTWFFETFVLARFLSGYRIFDRTFNFCFNSYYEALGSRQPRSRRGLLSRPGINRILAYRDYVDEHLEKLFSRGVGGEAEGLIELGINHEQQHQELLLTDILAAFAANPLSPAYRWTTSRREASGTEALKWIDYEGGVHSIGNNTGCGFAWDNEGPWHEVLARPFRLADRLITNGEWAQFISDGGYRTASLWLADGWALVSREGWRAPLYWEQRDGEWLEMTLTGSAPLDRAAPVCQTTSGTAPFAS